MTMANRTRTQLSTDSSTLFPDNNSQLISPQDLRDWLTNGIDSFLTQKDSSAMQNVIYENKGNSIASAATVDLSTATGNFLHITGTTNISSFGTCQAGSRFVLVFDGVLTLTYNGTSLIIPGSANKTTASGDCCMIVSEGSGNWRIVGYFPISGSGGGGGGTVTSITASSPLTGGTITTSGSIGIANAAADGATKGAATFDANDFNASSGLVSIDYANGQKASASQDGFLSSGDWSTFNGKGSGTITALTGDVTASGTGSVTATIANGAVDIPMLSATGTPSGTTFLRGDNVWATPSGGGGNPQGADGQIQYNNGGAFGGVSDLTWDDVNNVLTINNPRIGQSIGNGHLHLHSINTSAPSGVTDYVTLYADKSPKQIGARFETDGFTSALQFGATSDQTYTYPDASGNVVLDSASQTLSNKILSTPTIDGVATFANGTSAGEIRIREASGNGSEYVAIKAQSVGGSYSLTLPSTAPTEGQVMVSNSSGGLTWTSSPGRYSQQYLRAYGATTTSTTEVKLQSILIPANTFTDMNGMQIMAMVTRTLTGTNSITIKLYINTTDAVGGFNVNTSAWSITSSANATWQFVRAVFIQVATGGSKNTITLNQPTTSSTNVASSGSINSSAIDWAVDQYVVLSTTQTNASGVLTCNALQIIPS